MAPKFVKPYVKSNKNDRNDAEAIAEASRRPTMRFVGIKSMFQQEINAIHRVRENLVKRKTAISNEIRAMFFEFGVTIPKGITYTRKQVPLLLEDAEVNIPLGVRELIRDLYQELLEVFDKVEKWDKKLQLIYKDNEVCSRIGKVEGVGVITATAIIGAVGDPQVFSCGREFAAYLGLTPRQHSTGGKNVLLGISKRGDSYIRKNLIHGARAVVSSPLKKESKRNSWVKDKLEKRGLNKAAVALANKNARVIWALMAKGEEYKAA
jgi:transposase